MFCPKCSNLLMPSGGKMKCNCGYSQQEGKITEKKKKEKKIEVMDSSTDTKHLPEINADCRECKNTKAYFWTIQTRSSDEPETKFFRCTKCKQTWREY